MTATVGYHTFPVSLNYLSSTPLYQEEKPYEIWQEDIPTGVQKTNVKFELYDDIPIHDARELGIETFNIEKQGFEFLRQEYPHCNIRGTDDRNASPEQRDAILEYLDIMAKFLCERYGGTKAACYDWRVSGILQTQTQSH